MDGASSRPRHPGRGHPGNRRRPARHHPGRARRRRRGPGRRGRTPRHRSPAARRGRELSGGQAVRCGHGGGRRGRPPGNCRYHRRATQGRAPPHRLRPVGPRPRVAWRPGAGRTGRRGLRGAGHLPPARQCPGGPGRDHHDPDLAPDGWAGPPAAGGGSQCHDPRRAGHRRRPAGRRGHHRHRKRGASLERAALSTAGWRGDRGSPGGGKADRVRDPHRRRGLRPAPRHERPRGQDVPAPGRRRHRGGAGLACRVADPGTAAGGEGASPGTGRGAAGGLDHPEDKGRICPLARPLPSPCGAGAGGDVAADRPGGGARSPDWQRLHARDRRGRLVAADRLARRGLAR